MSESEKNFDRSIYDSLIVKYNDYINTVRSIFQLQTNDIASLYNLISQNLIQKYKVPSSCILQMIARALENNDRYIIGYWELFNKIYLEFKPSLNFPGLSTRVRCLIAKDLGINTNISPFELNFSQKTVQEILNVYESDNILYSIYKNDFEMFKKFANEDEFNINQVIDDKSLLEWASYYGTAEIFKYLRINGAELTENCQVYSYIGRNSQIINEIMSSISHKSSKCIETSICSHQIDFPIYFYMNFGYELPLEEAAIYFNLHCFLAMFCELKGADFCLVCSPSFGIPSLIEDLLANCKSFSDFGHLLLHAMNNCPEDVVLCVLDIIVEKGFDVNYIDENNKSPIMIAIGKIFKKVVKSLIDKGCDINKEYENNLTPIMYAKMLNLRDVVDVLIDGGAED